MGWPDTESFRLQPRQSVGFYGNSITHWYGGPERPDHPLGLGYCAMIGRMLTRIYQDFGLLIHDRGISGNRISHLLERFDRDVVPLKPNWISLLVGINDTASETNPGTPTADFERDYRALLERIKGQAQVVMMTPFFLSVPGGSRKLTADLSEKIDVVTALADTYADVFIPLHQYVAELGKQIDPALLVPDGVHPSQMGHGLIADH